MDKNIKALIVVFIFSFYSIFAKDIDKEKFRFSPTIKSVIIPGWGQYELKKYSRGNLFISTEALGIVLTTFSIIKSTNTKNTYIALAAEHAGVNESGKNHQYWVDIGNYNSREEFNDEHLRWREYNSLYPDEALWNWDWKNEKKRDEFEDLRIQSDKYELAAKFVIGGIVLNHIISAIDALYLQNISLREKVELQSFYNPETQFLQYSLQFNL